ncbi:UDP-N-acetylmuramate dehydrogenase [Oceanospirillum beijerinckii]|uniref:UDP-N-acetylmuramate dehydrogenase n=1 Tax=Oceanospirillum beijerinckii TaxID=64976 RepID=UPI00040DEDC5|nr:UDP-N-acetylmuramate dehydrogenase [Oceanospirillum beijerinckii]
MSSDQVTNNAAPIRVDDSGASDAVSSDAIFSDSPISGCISDKSLPENIRAGVNLQDKNTLGFAARARFFAQPDNLEQLQQALAFAHQQQLPVFPLGGGSNLILDRDLDAVVIQMNNCERDYQLLDQGRVQLTVGAGVNWHQLVMDSVERGYFGLENLALIPGSVGAAPVQNVGAYGVELADRLVSLQIVYIATGEVQTLSKAECDFAYRDSIFKQALKGQVIITQLTLCLSTQVDDLRLGYGDLAACLEGQELSAKNIAQAVCHIRQSKLPDPEVLGNAGSFFKNPVIAKAQADALKAQYPNMPLYPVDDQHNKLAAGWLIEQCGLKGYRKGPVGVYEKQALVLVHFGQGRVQNLLELAEEVKAQVLEKFAVTLEIEPPMVSSLI